MFLGMMKKVFYILDSRISCLILIVQISNQQLLERIDIEKYLDGIERVLVGRELDKESRAFDFDWAVDIRNQCMRKKNPFTFRQCGNYTIKDGVTYTIPTRQMMSKVRKANIDFNGE